MASCGGKQKFIIRTSDKSIFKSCRQRWDFSSKIRRNLEPKGAQDQFDFGTSIHGGLEVKYDPKYVNVEHVDELALAAFVLSEHNFKAREAFHCVDGVLSIEREQEYAERKELGIGMLQHYFEFYKNEGWKAVKVEIEFEIPIPVKNPQSLGLDGTNRDRNIWVGVDELHGQVAGREYFLFCWCEDCGMAHKVFYQGRVDLVIEDKHGNYWLVDHKTAKQFGSTEYLDLDDQCGSYIWALRSLNLPIQGVIYNRLLKALPKPPKVLQSGGLSKDKSQRTTYGLYAAAIAERNLSPQGYADILEFLKEKPNQFFQRVDVYRGPEEIPILERRIVLEAIDMLNDPSIYPNPGMFNCMGCAYKIPCLATQDGSDVEFILKSNYKERDDDGAIAVSGTGSTDADDTGRAAGPARL